MLQKTVGTIFKTFFLFALRIKFYQITRNVLDFGLGPLFDLFPRTRTEFADTRLFTFLSFIFGNFMQRVNGNKHNVIVLIDQFDDFLRRISIGNPYQPGKFTDTMINMYHIISRLKHVQLLE